MSVAGLVLSKKAIFGGIITADFLRRVAVLLFWGDVMELGGYSPIPLNVSKPPSEQLNCLPFGQYTDRTWVSSLSFSSAAG